MNYLHFVGIDLSKKTFDASVITAGCDEVDHFQLANTASGMLSLLTRLEKLGIQPGNVLFCAEDMGTYTLELCLLAVSGSLSLALSCPLDIKKSSGIQRGKSDRVDAYRIACYASSHPNKLRLYTLPEQALPRLKGYLLIRDNLIRAKKSLGALLDTLVDTSKLADMNELVTLVEEKVTRIKNEIKEIDKRVTDCAGENPVVFNNFSLLNTITGIGSINAAVMICLTANLTRFSTSRRFACYCGLAPFEYSSGTSIKGRTTTSKMANKKMKVLLTSAALSAIVHDQQLRKYYQRKILEGKHEGTVINAVRAKLVDRCFAVIRRQAPFVRLQA